MVLLEGGLVCESVLRSSVLMFGRDGCYCVKRMASSGKRGSLYFLGETRVSGSGRTIYDLDGGDGSK